MEGVVVMRNLFKKEYSPSNVTPGIAAYTDIMSARLREMGIVKRGISQE